MEDRFRSLYKLKQELYTEDAPLIIEKGSLLQDMQTNALVIQLKFHSISQKPFKALKIRINTYDVSHVLLPDVVEYQYLDMNIMTGKKFGSNKAILLKNSVIRSFEIQEYSVVYSDNTVETVHSPFEMLPLSKTLKQEFANKELENQYRIETVGQAMYVPIRYGKLWKCTCGEWNKDNICSGCKAEEEIVFKRLNIELLTEHMEKRLAERKIIREREAKLAAEEKKRLEEVRKIELAKKQKRTKIGLCAAGIIAVVLIFACKIYPDFIAPSMRYSHAKKMLSEKKYDDAVAEFEKLGSYKDAEDMVLEATTEKGKSLLEKGEYEKAKNIFESLDNQKMVNQTICKEVQDLISKEEYEKAKTILRDIPYSIKKNNNDMLKLTYQLAGIYQTNAEYLKASGLYKDIEDYKDSLAKWGECQIQIGKDELSQKHYDIAELLFEGVIREDDAPENIKEANEQIKKCEEEVNGEIDVLDIVNTNQKGILLQDIRTCYGDTQNGNLGHTTNTNKYSYTLWYENRYLDDIEGKMSFGFIPNKEDYKYNKETENLDFGLNRITWYAYEENVNDKNYQNLKKYLNGKLGKFIEEKNEDNKTETVWKDGYSLSYNQKLEDIVVHE